MFARFIPLASLLVLALGCAEPDPLSCDPNSENGQQADGPAGEPDQPESTHTITTTTQYYTSGPQQGRPPDGTFEAGTNVIPIGDAGSYWLVRAEDGVEAYIASDALREIGGQGAAQMNPDLSNVVQGNNSFAFDLYAKLRARESANLFFSPNSISTAFAMTYAGAKAETEEQIAGVLHFDAQQSDLHPAFAALADVLHSGGDERGYQLNVANRLWGQKEYGFRPDFLKTTRESYGAELAQVDFVHETDAVREEINTWVEGQTAKKIKDLIPQGALSNLTRLVLTNAVYFKGDWTHKFKEQATKDAPFHVTADHTVDVPMMFQTEDFAYGQDEDVQILGLPYGKEEHLSMLVLLPKNVDGLTEFEAKLNNVNLEKWASSLRSREVRVHLPRFKLASQFQLNDVLQSMGMTLAFEPGKADFSGMSTREELFISAAIHKAFVDVNEEGTEAAAATAITVKRLSLSPEPVVFRADHPFVFLIRDNRTKSIMFLGRVVNPQG